MAAFPEIDRIRFEGPRSKNPLAFRHYNADEIVEGKIDEGPPAVQRRLLAHVPRHGPAIRSGRARRSGRGTTAATRSRTPQKRARVAFEFIEKLGAPFYAFHDRDVAPEGANARRDEQEPRRGRQGAQGRAAADRHQAAVGHGQPVQQSALHARRGHQLQRRRLRLRRRPGEEGAGSHARSWAA